MNKVVKIRWRFRFRANGPPLSWRERVGDVFRRLASRIDKRPTVALAIESTPALSTKTKVACVKFGLDAIERALESESKEAASEAAIRAHMPQLYETGE